MKHTIPSQANLSYSTNSRPFMETEVLPLSVYIYIYECPDSVKSCEHPQQYVLTLVLHYQ
jgi:hypothetical protein